MDLQLRSYQLEVFNFIIENIKKGERRILIEMPVGSGKSVIISKAIKYLISNYNFNNIGLYFPGKSLVEYFKSTLNDSLSDHQINYEYHSNSIRLNLDSDQSKSNTPIFFIDESYAQEAKNILNEKESIVVGLYTIVKPEVISLFGKKKIDYKLTSEDLLSYLESPANIFNPTIILNEILKKLSIPTNKNKDITSNLIKLDLWVEQYLKDKKEEGTNDNSELIKIYVKRSEALAEFKKLLTDEKYFISIKKGNKEERVWQNFFEKNKWIFGLNLNLFFLSSLENRNYEQVVAGFNFNTGGKRADALLKSNGILSSFFFCEIKTHNTTILEKVAYRKDCYGISKEFAGALSQVQKTVSKATSLIKGRQNIKDKDGYDSNEIIFNYQPLSTIVIGSLNEFFKGDNLNEERYASFELFRKSLQNIQVITFDELYARAEAILGVSKLELE